MLCVLRDGCCANQSPGGTEVGVVQRKRGGAIIFIILSVLTYCIRLLTSLLFI